MKHLVSRLREKPEHHRRKVTFAVSAGVTALVFVVWVSVIFPSGVNSTVAKNNSRVEKNAETPINTLKTGVAQVVGSFGSIFESSESSIQNVDFGSEYEKMKAQVESGEVTLFPTTPTN